MVQFSFSIYRYALTLGFPNYDSMSNTAWLQRNFGVLQYFTGSLGDKRRYNH